MKPNPFFILYTIIALFFLPAASTAKDIIVSGENNPPEHKFTTIEAAIIDGASGDVIWVYPGEYNTDGNLSFGKKRMTLKSSTGNPADVVIRGRVTANSTFYITANDVGGSVISGVTIIGNRGTGSGDGGAMNIQALITIHNCVVRDSSARYGGGVHITAVNPTFKGCRFINNAANQGGAVYATKKAIPVFTNCLFTDNNRASSNGEAVYLDNSSSNIISCTFVNNENSDTLIYQYSPNVMMAISNSIIDTGDPDNKAVDCLANILFRQSEPSFMNCYINGTYDDTSVKNVINVFGPTSVVISKADNVVSSYPNEYVGTSTFATGFVNPNDTNVNNRDYHLRKISSCIGNGSNGSGSDMDGESRPYYLNGKTDIGADQFSFCYLVEHNITQGVTALEPESGDHLMAANQAVNRYYQGGKMLFYLIKPRVSGVLRIRSQNATTDVKAILTGDCEQNTLLASDDDSGGGSNFSMSYIYAESGKEYYLGVINKDNADGTFDLYIGIDTDGVGNSCSNPASVPGGVFDRTYFDTGYADRALPGSNPVNLIDFKDDEDVYKLEFTVPGTIYVTSPGGTKPSDVEATIRLNGSAVVAENTGSTSIQIVYDNTDNNTCYLVLKRSRYNEGSGPLPYDFRIRYFALDDRVNDVFSAMTPDNWSSGGVGTGGRLETSTPQTGEFDIKGNGIDIGGNLPFDEFYYAGKPVVGDFVLTARMYDLHSVSGVPIKANAKGGVMLRDSLDKESKCAFSGMKSTGGYVFNRRIETSENGQENTGTNGSVAIPQWVRIQREHNQIHAYYSNDGNIWKGYGFTDPNQAGEFYFDFSNLRQTLKNRLYAMLAVTSSDPARDLVNIPGHANYSYSCKKDHTATEDTMPRDLVVSMNYVIKDNPVTYYYVCTKDHISYGDFGERKDVYGNYVDNKPRLGEVILDNKRFECIKPHVAAVVNRPRSFYYVRRSSGLSWNYFRCLQDTYNHAPASGGNAYWADITEDEYNAVSAGDKETYSSSHYYAPPPTSGITTGSWAYWRVVQQYDDQDNKADTWETNTQYSSTWRGYWRQDKDATTCDCGSIGEPTCSETYNDCQWDIGVSYGVNWLDYWMAVPYTPTNGITVTDWLNGGVYETGQYVLGRFSNVSLDTRDIEIVGSSGTENGMITIPGDSDVFEFDIDHYGSIILSATGTTGDRPLKLGVFNALGEKIIDDGHNETSTGEYNIYNAIVSDDPTASNPTPQLITRNLVVYPGKYYLKVSANGHNEPIDYDLSLGFTRIDDDDVGNYRQSAVIMKKWSDVLPTVPLLYYQKEVHQIGPDTGDGPDRDYFKVVVPCGGVLRIMSDWAGSSGPVEARLLDSMGYTLDSKGDVRTANPHYPQPRASLPSWSSSAVYIPDEIVSGNGGFYKCILAGAGRPLTDVTYWQPVGAPPGTLGGIMERFVPAGTYYIRITGAEGTHYQLSVDFDDYGDDADHAAAARPHYAFNSFQGQIETACSQAFPASNDKDIFRLSVIHSDVFSIYTDGTSDAKIRLLNSSGTEILPNPAGSTSYPVTGDELNDYFIEVRLQDSRKTGDYVLHIDNTDDYSNTRDGVNPGVGTVVMNGSVSGVVERPADVDYFRFVSTGNGRVRFELDESIKNPIDIMMKLTDSEDRRLTHSSSGRLEFDVKEATTYYLVVKPQFTINTGNYRITCTTVAGVPDEDGNPDNNDNPTPGNDYASARYLEMTGTPALYTGSYLDGGIDLKGDYDFYYFRVTGPGILRVYSTGATDTYGYLFLKEGGMYNLVVSNDDSDYDRTDGYNFGMEYYVDAPAGRDTYFYVKVRAYGHDDTGAYQLFIRFTPGADDHGDECETATLVRRGAPGASWDQATGTLRFPEQSIGISGDRDYFKIVAGPASDDDPQADPGTVRVFTETGSQALDTMGYLKNEMCGTLTLNDNGILPGDGENFRITYRPRCPDGQLCPPHTYYAVVRSYTGSQTGTYNLNVVSNGAAVEPVSVTTMNMSSGGLRYFGFTPPGENSYLTASVTVSGSLNLSNLRFSLYDGKGSLIGTKDQSFPVRMEGLKKDIHYIRVRNTGTGSGDFVLTLNCTEIGSIGFGNASGAFTATSTSIGISGEGSGTATAAGQPDNVYFVFSRAENSFDFTAKVTFTGYGTGTQAGLSLREGLSPTSRQMTAMVMRSATAWSKVARYRTATGGAAVTSTSSLTGAATCYIRLHYDKGTNTFSTDFGNVTNVGGQDVITWDSKDSAHLPPGPFVIPMGESGEPLYLGFVYASGTDGTTRNVTFSNIELTEIPYENE
jgi:hypothetical protein